ncbi:MAG: glycosyl hydrolase [Planctomycetota bacterium]
MTHRTFALATWLLAPLFLSPAFAQDSDEPKDETPGVNSSLVSSLKFRGIGPALMSGRIGDIVVDPKKRSTWYVAACSGGVWKTTNAGVTWKPIFDSQSSYSIGCLALDPNDRFTLWVGTGENNSQRSVGYGDGLYKSTDGGASFKKVGLEQSEHIGRILVHPNDSDTVYVAAQGPLWKEGGDRGLYKTTNGGKDWSKILSISENTGINEVLMDPSNPDILYASAYQRRRHTWVLIDGGPESGIHKSIDGGKTWKKINRGLPGGDKGRIGMAISPINPEVIYAIVEAADGNSGFYRSSNRGETWSKMSSYVSSSPQYYQEIVACPHQFDRVYSLDTYMMVSEDGGKSFERLGEANKHVDNHALVIDPTDADHLIIGCDGGIYESWDRGQNYDYKANLPITQFYKVAVSNDKPFYYVYGGTQDNATQGGPSRTNNTHGIRNSDWFVTVFGDGFDPAVDPEDPDTIYSQWQYGGLVRFNRKTGERVDIKPQPETDTPPLRWNWDSALLISPHSHTRVYYGSQILFQSDDRGDSWKAISPDLSRNLDRNKLKVMGRVWSAESVAKNMSTSQYGTIVSVSESPLEEGLIYVGTDDGMLQVTEDGGENWRAVSRFGSLDIPEYGYINDIEADLHDADTVYVAVNNHKRGDFKPYIVKSTDRGKSWETLHGDLPERGSVYSIKQDHENPELLFCGTEFGCFTTVDGGTKWIKLGGLPTIAIRDIEIQRDENDLVLASFGRGFYILDDYSPLRMVNEELLEENAIAPIKKGMIYGQAAPLAGSGKAFQGAGFYTAPNPPYGVAITYHLKESLKTKKSERKEKDRKLAGAGKDTPYPSWEDFKAEDRETAPRVLLTIRDSADNVVKRISGSTSKGLHRTHWNLRHAGAGRGDGPLAIPGTYSVDIIKIVDGEITELVGSTEFEIEPLDFGNTSEKDREAIMKFVRQAEKLAIAVRGATSVAAATEEKLNAIRSVIRGSSTLDPELENEVRDMELRLMDIQEAFNGDPTKSRRNEPAAPGLNSRLRNMMMGAMGSTEGPTGTHRRQYEIAGKEFDSVIGDLKKLVEVDLESLHKKLDKSNAPWTPGRKIPDWRK